MTVINLSQITNPQPHANVLLQPKALPDLSGLKLTADKCLNEKVTVSLPVNNKPEPPSKPDKPGRPHQADSFQHLATTPAEAGVYDRFGNFGHNQPIQQPHRPPHECPTKPQQTISLTFIKPICLNPAESVQLPGGQSIPLDNDGAAWLVQPDNTIQKVNITDLLKQLGMK